PETVISTAPPPAEAVYSFSCSAFWLSSICFCIFCACFIRLFIFPGIPMPPGNPPRFARIITSCISMFRCRYPSESSIFIYHHLIFLPRPRNLKYLHDQTPPLHIYLLDLR